MKRRKDGACLRGDFSCAFCGYDGHSLDDFLTCTDAIILFLNSSTMKIEKASKGAVEFYVWSWRDLIGKNLRNIELPDEATIRKKFKRISSSHHGHFFVKHRTADGKIADMEVFLGFLYRKPQPFLCSVMDDITEKERTKDRFRELSLEITRIAERERKQFASYLHDGRILVFCCAQELMRNCIRHAKAHRMELSLWNEGSRMVPQLVNDEIGFDVASLDNTKTCRSFRFFSVRERVLAIEGALVIDRIDEGTCIDLIAPID